MCITVDLLRWEANTEDLTKIIMYLTFGGGEEFYFCIDDDNMNKFGICFSWYI